MDTKTLVLCIRDAGEEDADTDYMTFEILDNKAFTMFHGTEKISLPDDRFIIEDMDISVARRLRDFLNYAVKD